MTDHEELFRQFDSPYGRFDNSMLGAEFADELETVSRFWFACGYRPGIGAYLNFFLLRDFIVTHDTAHPPRFKSFRSMADSFYQTDLFIREVTDSGRKPSGGISSERVRAVLKSIMKRHQRLSIPIWMTTHFGFSLLENVERECGQLSPNEKRLHLAYMTKTYRIMGVPFSEDRAALQRFSRSIEKQQAGLSPNVEKHARNILFLGEMVGVSSRYEVISAMLSDATRKVFEGIHGKVRPAFPQRVWARLLGRVLMKQAVGQPRKAVPATA